MTQVGLSAASRVWRRTGGLRAARRSSQTAVASAQAGEQLFAQHYLMR